MLRTVAVFSLLFAALPLSAQHIEGYSGLRFRLDTPGARAAGMGSTSEATDDLFAAIANPAALARQKQRVAAVELRHSSFSTDFITGGTLLENPVLTPVESERSGIASAIVVVPADHVTWAVYYDEPINAGVTTAHLPDDGPLVIGIDKASGALLPLSRCAENCNYALAFTVPSFGMASKVTLRRLGVAAAWSRGPLSAGASFRVEKLDERAPMYFATPATTAEGERLTWTAGAQWQVTSAIRAGASYRSGAKFPTRERWASQFDFPTPSSFGAGLSADVTPHITLAADAVRVRYSEMENAWLTRFEVPDVTELHAGAELRIPSKVPVAIRAGWWRDPAHRMRATGVERFGLLDEDEHHLTAGIGLGLGTHLRFDAAIDRSERTTRASVGIGSSF